MKILIKNRKHLAKDGKTPAYTMQIVELPEHIHEQLMKLLENHPHEVIESVDDTKPTQYTYQKHQCKVTGVHMTRRQDDGCCTFCGGEYCAK